MCMLFQVYCTSLETINPSTGDHAWKEAMYSDFSCPCNNILLQKVISTCTVINKMAAQHACGSSAIWLNNVHLYPFIMIAT